MKKDEPTEATGDMPNIPPVNERVCRRKEMTSSPRGGTRPTAGTASFKTNGGCAAGVKRSFRRPRVTGPREWCGGRTDWGKDGECAAGTTYRPVERRTLESKQKPLKPCANSLKPVQPLGPILRGVCPRAPDPRRGPVCPPKPAAAGSSTPTTPCWAGNTAPALTSRC